MRLFSPARRVWWMLLAAMLVGAAAQPAAAQTVWPLPYQNNQIAIDVIAPSFQEDAVKAGSGGAYLSATYSLNENVELVSELPVARLDSGGVTESIVGNPYFGVGLSGSRTPFLVELGLRLPVVDEGAAAAFAGTYTDAARTRAFRPDETLVSALVNWRFELGRRTSLRVRGGSVYAEFPNVVNGTRRIEQDIRLKYDAQLWFEGDPTVVGLTATGRGTLTAPGAYGTKSEHWLAATVIGDFDYVRPGLLIGLSVTPSVRDVSRFFIGLTLSTSYGN